MIDSKVIPMFFKEPVIGVKAINFTLTESVLQMTSAIFTVRHLPPSLYASSQEDIFFIMYNAFNDFLKSVQRSADLYERELQDRSR
jgi:hypothetical protein